MIFVPGNSYYFLSKAEYNDLQTSLPESLASLLDDFTLHDDDKYYALASNIDEDEYAYLAEEGYAHFFDYKKSTQSVHPF